MVRYWIGVVSKEHVQKGVAGGFAALCHGKNGPLKRMATGDWIIFYSPTEVLGGKKPYQQFTAIGKIASKEPEEITLSPDMNIWKRDVDYAPSHETPIKPLISSLSFILNKKRWGFPFMRGFLEIKDHDFRLIATGMGIEREKLT